jgi:hypothetical protein
MMPQDLNAKTIECIACMSSALDKADQVVAEKTAAAEKNEELIPRVVDLLIDRDLIDGHQKEAAIAQLGDHSSALEVLFKVAERHEENLASLGTPAGQTKQASDSLTSPFVGLRTSDVKESDRRLFEGLGLASPQ